MIRLIAAIDRKRGIAKNGIMPWNIPEDEQFFTDQTKSLGGNVLSGGTTFRDAYNSQPLAGRQNYILTRSTDPIEGATVVNNIEKFLNEFTDDLWVAGGAKVFDEVIKLGKADELYLTLIDADFGCDTIFPEYDGFGLIDKGEDREQNGFHFKYARFWRKTT
jgi:dihydrofolate reductase